MKKLTILFICLNGIIHAQSNDYNSSMQGIKTIAIQILSPTPSVDVTEFSRNIVNDVELKLRLAHINVVYDINKCDGVLTVYISTMIPQNQGEMVLGYIASYSVYFSTFLMSSGGQYEYSTTWKYLDNLIFGSKEEVLEGVRNGTKDLIDKFLVEYLKANQK